MVHALGNPWCLASVDVQQHYSQSMATIVSVAGFPSVLVCGLFDSPAGGKYVFHWTFTVCVETEHLW